MNVNKKVKSTWVKALSQSDGNKDNTESLYINFRFKEIKVDLENLQQEKEKNSFDMNEKIYLNDSNKRKVLNFKVSDNTLETSIRIIIVILFVFVCIQFLLILIEKYSNYH